MGSMPEVTRGEEVGFKKRNCPYAVWQQKKIRHNMLRKIFKLMCL